MTNNQLKEVKSFVKEKAKKIKDPQHGWDHFQRVANNAQKIVKSLNIQDKIDLNLLLASCYLHDMNHAFYSPGLMNYFLEKKRLRLILPKILADLPVNENDKKIIENTVYSIPFSFPFKKLNRNGDLYKRILQDADTLDLFSREREVGLENASKMYIFYAFLRIFSGWALKYGRKHLKNYLNFPQLVKEVYV